MLTRDSRSVAALLFAACTAACTSTQALADSLSYIGKAGASYWYMASASDFVWQAGDFISLTGMEQVSGANEPSGFTVVYTPHTVQWTCVQQAFGPKFLRVDSAAAAGQVPYSIQSSHPGAGNVTGPEYVPEPATVCLFCGGLMVLAGLVWRRMRLST